MYDHRIVWTLVMTLTTCRVEAGDPMGHMKPLGFNRQCMTNVTVMTKFPAPSTFYHNFVKMSQPLIMRKVLEEGGISAYQKWSDEYLSKNHGEIIVNVGKGKKEDRINVVFSQKTYREFIQAYKKEDIFLSTDVPSSMVDDVNVPVTLHCGGFQNNIVKVYIAASNGGAMSTLHNDDLDHIVCVLDGKKQYLMADRRHKDLVQADGWYYNHGLYSNVDVEKVDMYKFPKFREIPWYNITLSKGDCLYLPFGWYYQVNTEKQRRNFDLTFRFSRVLWYNETECKHVDTLNKSPVPLQKFKMASGEHEGVEIRRCVLFEKFQRQRFEEIRREDFYTTFDGTYNATQKQMDECFDFIDENKDNKLTWKEIQLFDLKELFETHGDLIDDVINKADGFELMTEKETSFTACSRTETRSPESNTVPVNVKKDRSQEDDHSNSDKRPENEIHHNEL